ncbi:MAG: alpha-2-macroglobulin family protein [Desulfobacteraceae bacterium]|jgi:hypothetical protein
MKRRYFLVSAMVVLLFAPLCFAAFDSKDFAARKGLEITRITPEGQDVPPGQEIVIQFSKPVVPLGRMERRADEMPVTITPAVKGQWRWLNTSALSLQMDEAHALKPATRYTVIVKPGIKTMDGETLRKDVSHVFVTQRPVISDTYFITWRSPVRPVIMVSFDQPVTSDSIKKSMIFRLAENMVAQIRVKVSPDPEDQEKPVFVPFPGDPYILVNKPGEKRKKDQAITKTKGIEARRIWHIEPETDLDEDWTAELYLEPGLVSALGPEKGVGHQQVVQFNTFPKFSFLGLRYHTLYGKEQIFMNPDKLRNATADKANPLESVFLVFSAPVLDEEIKKHVTFTPDLSGGLKDFDPWEGGYNYSNLSGPHEKGREYSVRLPVFLQANKRYAMKEKKKGIRDEFGRRLVNPLDLSFMTDHRKPEFNLINNNAVLEESMATESPLAVTNLKSIKLSGRTLTTAGGNDSVVLEKQIANVTDVAFFVPLGIRELLNGKSGVVYGYIDSDPYLEKNKSERRFFSQVTPYQVLTKMGHFNTLVWVTDLSTGEPVEGAEVVIVKDTKSTLKDDAPVLAKAVTSKDGSAYLPGNETLDPELSVERYSYQKDDSTTFFIKVKKGEHMALLPIDSDFEIDTWRVSNSMVSSGMSPKYGHMKSWGTTAQGLYRAGDTLSYKIYVRNQDNERFVLPPLKKYHLTIKDPMDQAVFERKDIELSRFGAFDGSFKIPEKGAVGWYRFELSADFTKDSWSPMSVLVSDFTPAPFKVGSHLSGDMFRIGDTVEVTTSARLHAGGPYSSASTRIVARLEEEPFVPKNPVLKDYYFSTIGDTERQQDLYETMENLNAKGNLVRKFKIADSEILYGRMNVESSVRDDRGKFVSSMATAKYSGRDRFVGLKAEKWVYNQGEPATFRYIAVDERGKPVGGITANVVSERLVVTAAKVKGAGNAYLTTTNEAWVKEYETSGTCEKDSSLYVFTPKHTGSYRVTAEIKDSKGRKHKTELGTWVVGKGVVLWDEGDEYSLSIIPEQTELKIGDTARYLVKNPYPGAMALISVERYGVLKHWTQRFETSTPIIEFPVTEDYMPGFFVSVTIVSKRVADAPMDGNVDLGKPAFRTGYVESTVKNSAKEITVKVKPDKEIYKPGNTVKVSLAAAYETGRKKEPVELAVVVLDEAVFDLIAGGKSYFDPYTGFNHVDFLDVANYNLLTQLVGRTKFEKKGANPGGDGGSEISMRSVFDFVSYWNPSIVTDENGKADITFKVPDSLTGWKIFVMAVTPNDRMGLGVGEFKVNRPTEIRPVMPNLVRDGDSFKAGFTVMNRTDKHRSLFCKINVKGPLDPSMAGIESTTTVECPPYKRVDIWLPVKARGAGKLIFYAIAKDKKDGDGLKVEVPVIRKKNRETVATYGTTTEPEVTETLVVPEDAKTGSGEISVVLSPTVIGNLEGAFKYMRNYPYSCWEQKLGKGVAASNYLALKPYLAEELAWPDAGKLVKSTLEEAGNFQTPSGAMSFYIPEDRYASPYLSAYTAFSFNWLKKRGYDIPDKVESRLFAYLDSFLKRDVFPDFYSRGLSASVRAAALCALSEKGKLTLADLKRYESHAPMMDLFGKALFMQAALNTEGGDKLAEDMCRKILGYANATGGKYMFSETKDDGFIRILSTPMRDNAVILSAFVAFGERTNGKELVGDIPYKLVRAITQTRKNKDHWENTQENIFCMKALLDYAEVYEKEKPDMTVTVALDKDTLGKTSFAHVKNKAQTMKRDMKPDDPGKKQIMTLSKTGEGRIYYSPRMTFEVGDEKAEQVNAGIEIRKEICVERKKLWVKLEKPFSLKRGELVRVDLFISIPSARHFVVVDDAVPGGLEPVNRDLATSSRFDAEKGNYKAAGGSFWFKYSDWREYNASLWSFYHRELRHDSVRFYSDYLPPGRYHLSYTAQAIAEGEFSMMPVHAEEMYDPDVFGKGLPGMMTID